MIVNYMAIGFFVPAISLIPSYILSTIDTSHITDVFLHVKETKLAGSIDGRFVGLKKLGELRSRLCFIPHISLHPGDMRLQSALKASRLVSRSSSSYAPSCRPLPANTRRCASTCLRPSQSHSLPLDRRWQQRRQASAAAAV